MAKLNVNPTRMELAILKDRLSLASRGHKFLKDKQDELMSQFIRIDSKKQRITKSKLKIKLEKAMQSFAMAKSLIA